MKFCGFVIGTRIGDDGREWPETPTSQREDGEGPHWMSGDDWVGCFIAAFPDEAATELCCEQLDGAMVFATNGDEIREHYDVAADVAQTEWNIYRRNCIAAGFDPGEGDVLFVSGVTP